MGSDIAPNPKSVAQHQLPGSQGRKEGCVGGERMGGEGHLSTGGAHSPHLGTGDHSIGRELFPQFLIINGVIQVLHIQVHTLEEKILLAMAPPLSSRLPCRVGWRWATMGSGSPGHQASCSQSRTEPMHLTNHSACPSPGSWSPPQSLKPSSQMWD